MASDGNPPQSSDEPTFEDSLQECLRTASPTLSLSYSELSARDVEELARKLGNKAAAHITELDLGGNHLKQLEAEIIAKDIIPNLPNLTMLDLRDNRLGRGWEQVQASLLEHAHQLQYLDLCENNIHDTGAQSVAVLIQQTRVHSVFVGTNSLTPSGVVPLSAALHGNGSLTSLSLDFNSIANDGCKTLFAALRKNKGVTSLSISDNGIGDAGAEYIAEYLASSRGSLKTLNLSCNNIGPQGSVKIASALTRNSILEFLDYGCNPMKDEGCAAFANDAAYMKTLKHLDLTSAGFSDVNARALLQGLRKNPSIVKLLLYNNEDVTPDVHRQILQQVHSNANRTDGKAEETVSHRTIGAVAAVIGAAALYFAFRRRYRTALQ